jgi:hypothetical protein
MLEVPQRAERPVDGLMGAATVEAGDERDAAGVVLVGGVVQALLLQVPSPPMQLVRRGEGDALPASPDAGARKSP